MIVAIAPIPLIGFGYVTADPSAALMAVELMVSGKGSAHMASHGDRGALMEVSAQADVLFQTPGKGPRADRIAPAHRTSAIAKQPAHVMAGLGPLDVEITGSIDKGEQGVNRQTKAQFLARPTASIGTAQEKPNTASPYLMMASFAGSRPYSFTRAPSGRAPALALGPKAGTPAKISRGLVFQGESENEYQARQRRCLATAVYFEARGEPLRGQMAVAQVVMNRVRTTAYPDTICGVVYQGQWQRKGCQFSFACDGHADIPRDKVQWKQANMLARRVTEGKVWLGDIGHATHYHATYVKPRWRREMDRIKKIGQHIFYLMPGGGMAKAEAAKTSPDRDPTPARSG